MAEVEIVRKVFCTWPHNNGKQVLPEILKIGLVPQATGADGFWQSRRNVKDIFQLMSLISAIKKCPKRDVEIKKYLMDDAQPSLYAFSNQRSEFPAFLVFLRKTNLHYGVFTYSADFLSGQSAFDDHTIQLAQLSGESAQVIGVDLHDQRDHLDVLFPVGNAHAP